MNPVSISAETLYLYDNSSGVKVPTVQSISADGLQVTLSPVEALAANRQYYIYRGYGAGIYDLAGNKLSASTSNFRTAP